MFDAAEQDVLVFSRCADPAFGQDKQFIGGLGRAIDQDMSFEVGPAVLDGVELRSVGREILKLEPTVRALDELPNFYRPMRIEPIPNDDQRATNIPHQLAQEFPAFRGVDVLLGIEPEERFGTGSGSASGTCTDGPND